MAHATILWVGSSAESLSRLRKLILQIDPQCTVVTAPDAGEGIILAEKLSIDGALVDFAASGQDCGSLVRSLMESRSDRPVPVILLAEKDADMNLSRLGLETKGVAIMQRPLDEAHLAASLQAMLEKQGDDDALGITVATSAKEDCLEASRRLARVVSHDFNNVLQVILGYSSLLSMRMEPGSFAHETVAAIEKAAERARETTNQLLAFSRKGTRNNSEVDMHTVIQSAVDSVEHLLPEGLVVDQELLAERPLIIGDPEQLRRAIGIVLENAIEATSAPGALMLRTSWVEKKDGEPKTLRVQISDTGCGIPPEICDRLFEPYATAKKISREKGMGMAILYGIVKNHGGWVEVKTRPKKGTVVSLYLPAGDSSE